MKKKTIKRIKENVNEGDYKKLMAYVRGSDSFRLNTKQNLLRTFTFLYFAGLRVNEMQELKIIDIKNLLENGFIKITLRKTQNERKLYLTDNFKKELLKIFDLKNEDDENLVISKGANKTKRSSINPIVFITQINQVMKTVLGSGYTSHSFRQGLITEMGSKGINTKIISKFIGHRSVKTTMGYIKPTDEDIMKSLIR